MFILPTLPIKCGGAPQKIMYLCEETFRKNGVRKNSDVHFNTTAGNLFPNCLKYAEALKPIAESKGIKVTYKSLLTNVDKNNRVATFKDLDSGKLENHNFDFLHVTPP
jgi:sulfide:quinone oxidoreductase